MSMETKRQKREISPYLIVLLSFLIIILIGSFLLTLPFAKTDGQWGSYIDSLLAATSATCVTGLSPYVAGIGGELTFFGQLVMLIMIQIGGLGFVTVLTFFITLFTGKLQFKDRYFVSQAVGSTNVADIVKFVRKILLITFIVEAIGFLLGLPVFFTIYPDNPGEAIWNSIFTSISSFNNAGFDIFGGNSLIKIAENPIVYNMPDWCYYYLLSYIMILIIVGGISFLTIMEVFTFKNSRSYRAFTKICISMTAILIVFGFVAFFLTEGIKPTNAITPFQALFQSVSLRTAGFAAFDQSQLSAGGNVISCLFMFIGGCPLSTAGGIKTTTIFIVIIAIYKYLRGRQVTAFKRAYSSSMIVKAMALLLIAFTLVIAGYVAVWAFEGGGGDKTVEALIFEVFSAFGTTGLSYGITPSLSIGSKLVLCVLMYLGRLGPMTFFNLFEKSMGRKSDKHFQYVEEDILIG